MYVCICNALTEGHVKDVARQPRQSLSSVYDCLGVRPCCGKCASSLREILRANAPQEPIAAE